MNQTQIISSKNIDKVLYIVDSKYTHYRQQAKYYLKNFNQI